MLTARKRQPSMSEPKNDPKADVCTRRLLRSFSVRMD